MHMQATFILAAPINELYYHETAIADTCIRISMLFVEVLKPLLITNLTYVVIHVAIYEKEKCTEKSANSVHCYYDILETCV